MSTDFDWKKWEKTVDAATDELERRHRRRSRPEDVFDPLPEECPHGYASLENCGICTGCDG